MIGGRNGLAYTKTCYSIQLQVEPKEPHGVMCGYQVQKLLYRNQSCLRCLMIVVLPGPPLGYHGGSRFVPDEAVDPTMGSCGCVSINLSRILNGMQSNEMVRKLGDVTRRPECEVFVRIWEASIIQTLRIDGISSAVRALSITPCYFNM